MAVDIPFSGLGTSVPFFFTMTMAFRECWSSRGLGKGFGYDGGDSFQCFSYGTIAFKEL